MVEPSGVEQHERRLETYRRRVGRLYDGAAPVGHLVTRVCTHWETVGPHSFPTYVNPEERLQWRVHFDDPDRTDAFSDDQDRHVADLRGREIDAWEAGRLELADHTLRIEWLDGDDAATAWQANGWS
ncbi:hypothetical protein [Oerskovia sp. KBS0722]|uniref:hypothetical protein n=1 Tax=Oerskovia sp. KBS0722 TaxID=1179673 RepID=UPI0011A14606|nr:hypothetical protein [Oerskovia sp. KBS0722]QDW63860.1 hypothetical protein FFI11_016290 [Oerskovia sp. KBS0722]